MSDERIEKIREALFAFAGVVTTLPKLSKSPFGDVNVRAQTFDALDSLDSELTRLREIEARHTRSALVSLEAELTRLREIEAAARAALHGYDTLRYEEEIDEAMDLLRSAFEGEKP